MHDGTRPASYSSIDDNGAALQARPVPRLPSTSRIARLITLLILKFANCGAIKPPLASAGTYFKRADRGMAAGRVDFRWIIRPPTRPTLDFPRPAGHEMPAPTDQQRAAILTCAVWCRLDDNQLGAGAWMICTILWLLMFSMDVRLDCGLAQTQNPEECMFNLYSFLIKREALSLTI